MEAGMKKIKLSPTLLGLDRAYVEIPTPCGLVTVEQEKGKKTKICAPEGIEIVAEK